MHPLYTRRGIATSLAKLALEEADNLDLPIFLEATPVGAKTYTSKGWIGWGFETKERVALDLAPYGVHTALYENSLMWRDCKSVRELDLDFGA